MEKNCMRRSHSEDRYKNLSILLLTTYTPYYVDGRSSSKFTSQKNDFYVRKFIPSYYSTYLTEYQLYVY